MSAQRRTVMGFPDDVHLNVISSEEGEVAGIDTSILVLPAEFEVSVDEVAPDEGQPALALMQLGRFLRQLGERQAADIGEQLLRAEWVVTSDPATVEARGAMHDCDECRAGVRAALRMMRQHPGTRLIVGTLYWKAVP